MATSVFCIATTEGQAHGTRSLIGRTVHSPF